ncbi:MAG: ABC transporter ATP-binding protein/permease, partial [Eubacterium sp.]|nr:ABC transporter ATP-binding protein/permease [Eubacterium sp.]
FILGVPRVNDGSITITELAAFQSYMLIAYQSISSVPDLYTNFMYYNGMLFYISGLMAEKEDIYDREHSMDMEDQNLEFRNVTFAYGNEPVIKNASFTIPKGKVTVIAGPNGSGKTTLFKLIERFYIPDSGEMRFGQYDAEDIHLQEWRQSIGYVLQEPQLFNGTIRDNINYGMSREVMPEETESAAKLACADEFIKELPDTYDFIIGDNGNRLSAGQRQRIAIARAVMLDPSYLLLDEATCNMDVYSENAVTKALFSLMKGRTTVMISHDMNMLEKADHIVVINDGNIEAEGSKAEVLEKSETLKKLIAANA